MKYIVTKQGTMFCGDHNRDVTIAHEVKPGETVDDLVMRLLHDRADPQYCDHIEIRRIKEARDE